jgi:ankyrin repeat protein
MTKKQPKRHDRPGIDRYGRTPLHYAAMDGDAAHAESLLKDGADPDAPDDNGWTPLHFAAQTGSVPVAEALLSATAAIDPRDANGNTPLSTAVFNSRGEGSLIQLLRSHGADPLAANAYGETPAGLAREIANHDIAQFFTDVLVSTAGPDVGRGDSRKPV